MSANLAHLALMATVLLALPGAAARSAEKYPGKVADLSIEQLLENLDEAPRTRPRPNDLTPSRYEQILVELVRRGGPEVEKRMTERLAQHLEQLAEARRVLEQIDPLNVEAIQLKRGEVMALGRHLELLTATRRVQGKPAPLEIIVDLPDDLRAYTRSLPTFRVSLKSADVEKVPLRFSPGGNFLGRAGQWRFEVRDEHGNLLPTRPAERTQTFSSGERELVFGDVLTQELLISAFVVIPKAGEYTARVLWHPNLQIADIANPKQLEGLLLFRSQPLTLQVEFGPRIVIELKPESRQKARELLQQLDNDGGPIKYIGTDYNNSYHGFIAPESPQGQLLALGRHALPELFDALSAEGTSPRRRAWILALLYSVVHEPDLEPRKFAPAFATFQGRIIEKNRSSSHSSSTSAAINTEMQDRMIEKWQQFRRDYVEIIEPEGAKPADAD